MITQAVISAGGLGTRLRPMTDTLPKPMIPILGKPLLEWHIEQFKKYGVREFFITLQYLPEVVMEYFGDGSRFGVQIQYFVEKEPLDSAGAIKKFESKLDDTFFFIYGDVFSLMDYAKMEQAYAKKENPIGMQRVKRGDAYADADVVELDEQGQFVQIHSKPHTETYENACRMSGSFILDKKILPYISEHTPCNLGRELLPKVVAAGEHFYAYECDEYSKGVDTKEKLEEVISYIRSINQQNDT